MVRSRSCVLVLLGAAFLVFVTPTDAGACQPLPSSFEGTVPVDGAPLPVNSAFVIRGALALGGPVITLDGQPAALVLADDVPAIAEFADAFGYPVRVEPAPVVGQTLAVSGNLCDLTNPCDEGFGFQFVAADVDAPAGVGAVDIDLHGFTATGGAGSCAVLQDRAWYVRWDSSSPAPPASPEYHVVELAADEEFGQVLRRAVAPALDGRIEVRLPHYTGESPNEALVTDFTPEPNPAYTFCVRVRTLDLAGNEGAVSEPVCTPKHCRIDPPRDAMDPDNSFDQPSWNAGDLYPGNCALPDDGCSCNNASSPARLHWSLVLVPLLWRARRRRR